MQLKTNRLIIRTILAIDTDFIHELHSLKAVDEFNTLGIPNSIEITREFVIDKLNKQIAMPRVDYTFIIEDKSSTNKIGLIGLNIGKLKYQKAEIWFKLHEKYFNNGFCTEAALQVLNFGFNHLKLHRIEAGCAIGNFASKKVIQKIGMREEGMYRKMLPIRGEWVDGLFFSILKEEFDSLNAL
jgi:[ribosomal protein S5]-alanine N-acetyltransferase